MVGKRCPLVKSHSCFLHKYQLKNLFEVFLPLLHSFLVFVYNSNVCHPLNKRNM